MALRLLWRYGLGRRITIQLCMQTAWETLMMPLHMACTSPRDTETMCTEAAGLLLLSGKLC